jgi:hypothetical protein
MDEDDQDIMSADLEFSVFMDNFSDEDIQSRVSMHSTNRSYVPGSNDNEDLKLNIDELDKLIFEHIEIKEHDAQSEFVTRSNEIVSLVMNGKPLEALQIGTHLWSGETFKERNAKLQLEHFFEMVYLSSNGTDDQHRLDCIEYCKNVIVPIVTPYESLLEQARAILPQLVLSNLRDEDIKIKRESLANELRPPITQSIFSILLRYLITVHNMFHVIKGTDSPYAQQLEHILLPDRAPRPKLPLVKSEPDRRNVQIMAQLLGLIESEAIEILSSTPDLVNAMKIELCRYDLNQEVVKDLCQGYCSYRKILDSKHVIDGALKELAFNFKYEDMIQRVIELDSKLWERHPQLLFELRCDQMKRFIACGDYGSAVDLAMKKIAPMTLVHAELVSPFRDIAVLLGLPPQGYQTDLSNILTKIDTFIREAKSMKEKVAELIEIFKYLLQIHTEWFNQMGSVDPFHELLEKLKIYPTIPSPGTPPLMESSISSSVSSSAMHDSDDDSDEDSPVGEQAVTMLMEVMRLRREEAIELLRRHHGDIESVFNSLFGV